MGFLFGKESNNFERNTDWTDRADWDGFDDRSCLGFFIKIIHTSDTRLRQSFKNKNSCGPYSWFAIQ